MHRSCTPQAQWEKVNQRARKVTKRRNRRKSERKQRPDTRLEKGHRRVPCFSGTVHRDSSLYFLFRKYIKLAKHVLYNRKHVDEEIRPLAVQAVDEADSISIERYARYGAQFIVTYNDEEFRVPIRENDCLIIDDWQWLMNRNEEDQKIIMILRASYPELDRWHHELLLAGHKLTITSVTGGFIGLEVDEVGIITVSDPEEEVHTSPELISAA